MFSSQVHQYMEIFHNKSKSTSWRDLKELEKYKIIDRKSIFNISYIKLKKAAIRFVLDKSNDQISSVSYKARALKRSAFINEIILGSLRASKNPIKKADSVILHLRKTSTLLDKDKDHAAYLQSLLHLLEGESLLHYERLHEEFESLSNEGKSLYDKTHTTFSSMPNINMFMLNIPSGKKGTFKIGILNLNNDLKGKKAIDSMEAAYKYLNILLPFWDKAFILYCEDDKIAESLRSELKNSKRSGDLRVVVKSLDITTKMFKGTKFVT